ncbi:MAG: dockerin type I domain-containing protein [Planctomycetota bacterium]|jgi:hypothetical protein
MKINRAAIIVLFLCCTSLRAYQTPAPCAPWWTYGPDDVPFSYRRDLCRPQVIGFFDMVAGQTANCTVNVCSQYDESIAVELIGAPEGMSVDENWRLTWQTDSSDVGLHYITLQAQTPSMSASATILYKVNRYPPPFRDYPGGADLDRSGCVDFTDFAILAEHWGGSNCLTNRWCAGADLDKTGSVAAADLAVFAQFWLTPNCADTRVSCEGADVDRSGRVTFLDFAVLAQHWLNSNCLRPDWCGAADLDRTGFVAAADLAVLTRYWLEDNCIDTDPACAGADLNTSGYVDFADFALLAQQWQDANCISPDFCRGADLDKSGLVDTADLAILGRHWLRTRCMNPCGQADLDDNSRVGFTDFALLAAAWLTTPADSDWNPICDLAVPYDDLIDTRDLDVLLHNWLKSNCKSNK